MKKIKIFVFAAIAILIMSEISLLPEAKGENNENENTWISTSKLPRNFIGKNYLYFSRPCLNVNISNISPKNLIKSLLDITSLSFAQWVSDEFLALPKRIYWKNIFWGRKLKTVADHLRKFFSDCNALKDFYDRVANEISDATYWPGEAGDIDKDSSCLYAYKMCKKHPFKNPKNISISNKTQV